MTDLQSLQFIGGIFFDLELPKERRYLLRYFRTQIEKAFIHYYYCFKDFKYFTEHTGYYCQRRWLIILLKRHDGLVAIHDKAKAEMDLELLARIESGKYKRTLKCILSGNEC